MATCRGGRRDRTVEDHGSVVVTEGVGRDAAVLAEVAVVNVADTQTQRQRVIALLKPPHHTFVPTRGSSALPSLVILRYKTRGIAPASNRNIEAGHQRVVAFVVCLDAMLH